MTEKTCRICGEVKPLEMFTKPVPTFCKACATARNKEWRHRQRAIVLAARGPVVPRTEKACKKCGEVKPIDEFYLVTKGKQARCSYCKPCSRKYVDQQRKKAPALIGRATLRYKCKRAGTTAEWFLAQFEKQNGKCAICGSAETHRTKRETGTVRSLAIDHDHETGVVRGLLCFRCNTSVHLLDKYGLEWAEKAVRYMESSRKKD